MGEQKGCKKKGRNSARCKKYYNEGHFMHNVIRRRVKHVKAHPEDKGALGALMSFAETRGGLEVVRQVKARLEA